MGLAYLAAPAYPGVKFVTDVEKWGHFTLF
jgi:hypothetical protein